MIRRFLEGIGMGLIAMIALMAVGFVYESGGAPAQAQDLTSDLAFLLRGTIPRVAVTVDGDTTFAVSPRFPWAYVLLACTDAEAIDTITGGRQGLLLIIEHTDSDCTLNDDNAATATDAMDLVGTGNDIGAAAKVIGLIYNGTSWYQLWESDN